MYKVESLEKLAGGVISDHLTYGPVGSLAARREQIINEIAEAEVDAQKNKASSKARPKAHAISELLGPITSHFATGLAGAGIGALAGGRQGMLRGAAIGGSLSYASKAIAAIAAAIKRRRTKEEQLENDKGSILKKYLIPGLAEYDLFKRQGRAFDENDEYVLTWKVVTNYVKDCREPDSEGRGGKQRFRCKSKEAQSCRKARTCTSCACRRWDRGRSRLWHRK